jgi:hypothetical protein
MPTLKQLREGKNTAPHFRSTSAARLHAQPSDIIKPTIKRSLSPFGL